MIRSFEGIKPQIGEGVYIDDTAVVIGNVVVGDESSIWPQTVVRGDVNTITIGSKTNIQDGSILHVSHSGPYNPDGADLVIGDLVTIGHKVLLHACHIGNACLIGMGSIVMDRVTIQDQVILAAGSLVPENKILEQGHLYLGSPAKKIRKLTETEKERLVYSAQHYVSLKNRTLQT